MNLRHLALLTVLALIAFGPARAADHAGKWTAEFDSQIGVQKYLFEFKVDGDKLSGKATFDQAMGKGDTGRKDIKVSGDSFTFTEPMKFNDSEIGIAYTGKIDGDEIKLTRTVGDFATEQLVAKRAKVAAKTAATK